MLVRRRLPHPGYMSAVPASSQSTGAVGGGGATSSKQQQAPRHPATSKQPTPEASCDTDAWAAKQPSAPPPLPPQQEQQGARASPPAAKRMKALGEAAGSPSSKLQRLQHAASTASSDGGSGELQRAGLPPPAAAEASEAPPPEEPVKEENVPPPTDIEYTDDLGKMIKSLLWVLAFQRVGPAKRRAVLANFKALSEEHRMWAFLPLVSACRSQGWKEAEQLVDDLEAGQGLAAPQAAAAADQPGRAAASHASGGGQ